MLNPVFYCTSRCILKPVQNKNPRLTGRDFNIGSLQLGFSLSSRSFYSYFAVYFNSNVVAAFAQAVSTALRCR